MRRAFLGALLAIPLAAKAFAATTAGTLDAAKLSGQFAAASPTNEAARMEAGSLFDGGKSAAPAVAAGESSLHRNSLYASPGVSQAGPTAPPGPQLPASDRAKSKFPPWAMYAAGGGLGFLQGALFGGLMAGLGGAAIGLAATHFYMKDQPEVSLGISAGSIVGSFLGGPIGALVGAAVGGLVGWLVGKLF